MPDNASNTKTADQILKEVQKERRRPEKEL